MRTSGSGSRNSRPHSFQMFLLGLAVAGLLASSLVAPGEQGPATDVRPVSQERSPNFTMFTLNVAFPLGVKKVRHDIRRIMLKSGTDAGGFQEFSGPRDRRLLRRIAKRHNWGWYMPDNGARTIPIVWKRSRFRLIKGESRRVHRAEKGVTPSRWINIARLREIKTGKVFVLINAHTIAKASFDAQPHDRHGNTYRVARLRKHLAMLREAILDMHGISEHVVAVGDLNVNFLADQRRRVAGFPTKVLGPVVTFNMPNTGSHGRNSLLDYNMSVKRNLGGAMVPTKTRIRRKFHSDHDAVVTTYRMRDLFRTGPLFNNIHKPTYRRRNTTGRFTRAVQDTEPGSALRLVTNKIDEPGIARSLRRADRRGVHVQVILDNRGTTPQERSLIRRLGTNRGKKSWVKRCAGACRPGGSSLQSYFLMATRTGGAKSLVMQGSGNATNAAGNSWNDAFIATNRKTYDAYLAAFRRMAAGKRQPNPGLGRVAGPYRVFFRARTSSGKDVVRLILNGVRCGRSTSPRTPDRRTDVFVVAGSWSGARGARLARKLVALDKRGCDLKVAMGRGTSAKVKNILSPRVRTHSIRTRQAAVVVDGHYRKGRNRHIVWTGTAGWTDGALKADQAILRSDAAADVVDWRRAFNRHYWR